MDKQFFWIRTGYEICSLDGFNGLKIERLAKIVGVSKSSFYHYFADLEYFIDLLLDYHYKRFAIIANKEKNCLKIYPDLIDIFLEHKTDLLFHRQLRMNRKNNLFEKAIIKSNTILGNYSMMLWAKDINHNLSQNQLEGLFKIVTDDFYMKINEENLNHEFLSNYLDDLRQTTQQLIG